MQQKKFEHETQKLRRCGLHAVNNLLQENKYTREHFENIAAEIKLQTNNSHCTYYLGNYDLNVIERVLLQEQYELQWIRQNEQITERLITDQNVYGLLINKIKEASFIEKVCQWEPRHWISIKKNIKPDNSFEFSYHDSQLNSALLKQTSDLVQQLVELQKNKDNHLLLVKKKQVN